MLQSFPGRCVIRCLLEILHPSLNILNRSHAFRIDQSQTIVFQIGGILGLFKQLLCPCRILRTSSSEEIAGGKHIVPPGAVPGIGMFK